MDRPPGTPKRMRVIVETVEDADVAGAKAEEDGWEIVRVTPVADGIEILFHLRVDER